MTFKANPHDAHLIKALLHHAETTPDKPWLTVLGEGCLTFGEALSNAQRMAGFLKAQGIAPGDHVGVMLPNSLDFVRVWLGLGVLGAVAVLLNTELTKGFLAHQLTNSDLKSLIISDDLADTNHVEIADSGVSVLRTSTKAFAAWSKADGFKGPVPEPQDIACIMYTSGTSGPAKAVLMPHRHCALYGFGAARAFQVTPDDRYYICLPLFHANGLLMQLGTTLLVGAEAVLRPRFSASNWLADIRAHECTITYLLGALAAFVIGQTESNEDRNHSLRAVLNGPNIAEHEAVLRERFGIVDVISGFGMTEVNIPIWGKIGRSTPGAAGWPQEDMFDVIIADPQTDVEVSPGEVGEILVRPKIPAGFMAGYYHMPDKTVEAWRNLWFHTGDAGIMDEDRLVTFVDRIKDCIRRRGENISATEVEAVVAKADGVEEVAACAVPADIVGGEDEILLAIVAKPTAHLRPETIRQLCEAELPRFAQPRYLRFVGTLPKTATGKIQRAVLKKHGARDAIDLQGPKL